MKSRTLRPTESTLELVGAGTLGAGVLGVSAGATAVAAGGGSAGSMRSTLGMGFGGGAKVGANGRGGEVERARAAEAANDDSIEIPILGRVAAGMPIEAIEHRGDTVRIDRMLLGRGARGGDVFGLRIQGESMIEAGIHDGDYVFVRKQAEAQRGAIVIAMTCKYFFPESTHVRLEPANASMAPILVPKTDWRETQILGVVVGVFRKI
jgi:SOS regulatory protein LexA